MIYLVSWLLWSLPFVLATLIVAFVAKRAVVVVLLTFLSGLVNLLGVFVVLLQPALLPQMIVFLIGLVVTLAVTLAVHRKVLVVAVLFLVPLLPLGLIYLLYAPGAGFDNKGMGIFILYIYAPLVCGGIIGVIAAQVFRHRVSSRA
jgi:hypothetical protein